MSDPAVVARLQTELNDLPAPLAESLALRGVRTKEQARHYFRASTGDLHDPFDLADMDRAVGRIMQAVDQREKVVVYGDYDVDGTTGTAMLTDYFRRIGVETEYFVPHRLRDGYGLSTAGLEQVLQERTDLVVAIDCGITAVGEADWLRERGVDLIVCDHHEPKDTLPMAAAVLDPKRSDSGYPFKELSGCGVGFKLLQALAVARPQYPDPAEAYLDLLAVSTASDIVPLVGENRILMREGLTALRNRPRPGFAALAVHARIDLRSVTTRNIVFALGPRINAAGRVGEAARAVDLLMTADRQVADRLAGQLEKQNDHRRDLDRATVDEAVDMAAERIRNTPFALVLYRADWHPGVIGIVASRIVEQFYRPAVLLTKVNGAVKGSARSIAGINVFGVLERCSDLLTDFGGHEFAAGMSLPEENVSEFEERFNEIVASEATDDILTPKVFIDADLDLQEVDSRFWAVLQQFEPHGPENRTPVFRSDRLEVIGDPRLVGGDSRHLKFSVRPEGGGPTLDVIGFGLAHLFELALECRHTGGRIDLLHSVSERNWNGRLSLQLRARDLRASESL